MNAGKWIYLSGPMSGRPEFNYPTFTRAAAWLRSEGFRVVSPHEIAHPDGGVTGSLPWADYVRADLVEMLAAGCNAIALLPGWEASRGARIEVKVARALGFEVWHLREWPDELGGGWGLADRLRRRTGSAGEVFGVPV